MSTTPVSKTVQIADKNIEQQDVVSSTNQIADNSCDENSQSCYSESTPLNFTPANASSSLSVWAWSAASAASLALGRFAGNTGSGEFTRISRIRQRLDACASQMAAGWLPTALQEAQAAADILNIKIGSEPFPVIEAESKATLLKIRYLRAMAFNSLHDLLAERQEYAYMEEVYTAANNSPGAVWAQSKQADVYRVAGGQMLRSSYSLSVKAGENYLKMFGLRKLAEPGFVIPLSGEALNLLAKAKREFRAALEDADKIGEEDGIQVLAPLSGLGEVYESEGRYEEAVRVYRELGYEAVKRGESTRRIVRSRITVLEALLEKIKKGEYQGDAVKAGIIACFELITAMEEESAVLWEEGASIEEWRAIAERNDSRMVAIRTELREYARASQMVAERVAHSEIDTSMDNARLALLAGRAAREPASYRDFIRASASLLRERENDIEAALATRSGKTYQRLYGIVSPQQSGTAADWIFEKLSDAVRNGGAPRGEKAAGRRRFETLTREPARGEAVR